ncbi:MAG: hypothetical protein JNN07_12685 [Verrucomicrobiales bacterium]|nr:hypothetical protein [Verrucomicrobiales bacterium]
MFDFLHEFAHAQLQNGVLGLTLQLLHKLPAPIEKMLFQELRQAMLSWRNGSPEQKRLFRELFLFGEPREGTDLQTQMALSDGLIHDVRELLNQNPFRTRWQVFELINERRTRLHNRWKILHEGFATFVSVEVACGESEFSHEIRERVVERLIPGMSEEARGQMFREVREVAQRTSRRRLSVRNPHSSYTKGFQLIERLREAHRSPFVAMVAVVAASHFAYPAFSILDVSRDVFDSWVSDALNPLKRLTYLIENPNLLRPFSDPSLTTEALPVLMTQLLRRFPDFPQVQGMPFGTWAVDHLWGSATFSRAFDQPPLATAHVALEKYQQLFCDDRSEIFSHGEVFFPTLLFADGTVVQNDENLRRAFLSNFIDFYEVERTSRLLTTFSDISGVFPPEF